MHRPADPAPYPLQIVRAEGCWVFDVDGRRYLDLQTPHAALNFGHRHPALVAAATAQLAQVHRTSYLLPASGLAPLTAQLAAALGAELGHLLTSRHEALRHVGAAVRHRHGGSGTILALGAAGKDNSFVAEALGGEVRAITWGRPEALTAALAEVPAVAVLLEPVRLERHVVLPPPGYIAAVAAACHSAGAALVVDESACGLGRMGPWLFAKGEVPGAALWVLGHALGGGIVPVTAVVGPEALLGPVRPQASCSPLAGNALACRVAQAAVDLLADGELLRHGQAMGRRLAQSLRAADLPAVAALEGGGLWLSIELAPQLGFARPFCERLVQQGVLAIDAGDNVLQVAPALVVGPAEVDWAVERLVEVLGVPTAD